MKASGRAGLQDGYARPVPPLRLRHLEVTVKAPGIAGLQGWCAKGPQKLPVWATVPALCLAVEVSA